MSDEIANLYKLQYADGLSLVAQQLTSTLRGACTPVDMAGESKAFADFMGTVRLQKKQGRNTDTPIVGAEFKRRWIHSDRFIGGDYIDEVDKLKALVDPTNTYTQAFAAAAARAYDRSFVEGVLGTNYVGEKGTTPVTLPASQVVGDGTGLLTFELLKTAVKKLKQKHAIQKGDTVHLAWNAHHEDKFINSTEVKSSDFTTKRVIDMGGVDEFYRVQMHLLEDEDESDEGRMLPLTSTKRSLILWVPRFVNEGIRQDTFGDVSWDHKKRSYYVDGGIDVGHSRAQEVGVVRIDVLES